MSPPVGTDVLRKQHLVGFEARFDQFEARLGAAIDHHFDHLRRMLSLVIVVGFVVMMTANVAVTLLR